MRAANSKIQAYRSRHKILLKQIDTNGDKREGFMILLFLHLRGRILDVFAAESIPEGLFKLC